MSQEERQAHWKRFYEDGFHRLGPSPFCEEVSAGWRGLRIVDAGCGCGADAAFIAGLGNDVVAIDSCPSAGKQCGLARFKCGSVLELPPDVDVIYCRWLLHALTPGEQRGFLIESWRVLKPGGLLAMEFRTTLEGVGPGHYRRAVPLGEARLQAEGIGFATRHASEGRGRSAVGDDDPPLGRIVATKREES